MTGSASGFSFSRSDRLGGRGAFAAVFAFKCSAAGQFFQVYARPNSRPDSRLGVTVSKKFVPRATARNLCKRLAREIFRIHGRGFSGVDLVVRARSSAVLSASSAQARAEILDLMQQAQQRCCAAANTR